MGKNSKRITERKQQRKTQPVVSNKRRILKKSLWGIARTAILMAMLLLYFKDYHTYAYIGIGLYVVTLILEKLLMKK